MPAVKKKNNKLIIVVVLVAVIFIAVMLFYLSATVNVISQSFHQQKANINITILPTLGISSRGYAFSNNAKYIDGFALINYSFANASNANITLAEYTKPPEPSIYLINIENYCYKCFFNEQTLYSQISADLRAHDLLRNSSMFSYININDVRQIPENSIVIIPSGLLPLPLTPSTASNNFTILNMLSRGDSIIYMGNNFTESVTFGGIAVINNQSVAKDILLAKLNTSSVNASAQPINSIIFNSPLFGFQDGYFYGDIATQNSLNGTLIAFSNYPSTAWKNQSSMAMDIANVIDTRYWLDQIAVGYSNLTILNNSRKLDLIVTSQKQVALGNNTTSELNNSYAILTARLYNNGTYAELNIPFRMNFSFNGEVRMSSSVGETQTIPIDLSVYNLTGTYNTFRAVLLNTSMDPISTGLVGDFNKPFAVSIDQAFNFVPGYYFIELLDGNNNLYATGITYLDNTTITPVAIDFKNATFSFFTQSNNITLNNVPYSISLNNLFEQNGTIRNGTITYDLPKGTILSHGNETFAFEVMGKTYTYISQYSSPTSGGNALYIEFGIAIIVVVFLNIMIRPELPDDYYIDLPDFTASKKARIKEQPQTLVNVFDSINARYRWKYMPLTTEEFRYGISNGVRHDNVPISITQQNAYTVLMALQSAGLVIGMDDYFAPVSWEEKSRHDIEYLVVFRKLRDFCVAGAMLFTELDQSDKADMVIIKSGVQYNAVIYSEKSYIRPFAVSSRQKTLIAFLNEEAKEEFLGKLYSSYDSSAEIIKAAIAYSYVKLVDTSNTDELVL